MIGVLRCTLESRGSSPMLLKSIFACMSKDGADLIVCGAKVNI